jgi:heme/copper-type cytochrome/quinol oxidase subunit 2
VRRHLPTLLTAAALLALLALAVSFTINAWTRTAGSMSIHGWIALGLGIVFSVVIGCGLMVLMFYSSRRGYDDAASFTRDKR